MPRTDQALLWLVDAIANGAEFPDACPQAARMFRVNYDRLVAAYDEYSERRSYRR